MNAAEYKEKMDKFCKKYDISPNERASFLYLVENFEVFKNFYHENKKIVDEYRKLFLNSKKDLR